MTSASRSVAGHSREEAVKLTTSPRFVVDQPGGNVALDLFVIDQHLGALLDEALAVTGTTAAMYAVYGQLAQGLMSPGQLRERLGLRAPTLSGYLKTMEEIGHAVRERSPSDGRSAVIDLTAAGRAKYEECRGVVAEVVHAIHESIGTAHEVEQVRLALATVDRALLAVHQDTRDRPATRLATESRRPRRNAG